MHLVREPCTQAKICCSKYCKSQLCTQPSYVITYKTHANNYTCTDNCPIGLIGGRSDRAIALINNRLRRPYSSATTLDLGVLPQMANRDATCEKAFNDSGPQAPSLPMVQIANSTQHTWDHFRYVFCVQLPLLKHSGTCPLPTVCELSGDVAVMSKAAEVIW